MDLILTTALCFYEGCMYLWHLFTLLPYPTWSELFKSVTVFVALYPIRIVMKALLPEDRIARRVYKRRHTAPTAAEHQGATAIASEIFNH